jgi:hypothetical protein
MVVINKNGVAELDKSIIQNLIKYPFYNLKLGWPRPLNRTGDLNYVDIDWYVDNAAFNYIKLLKYLYRFYENFQDILDADGKPIGVEYFDPSTEKFQSYPIHMLANDIFISFNEFAKNLEKIIKSYGKIQERYTNPENKDYIDIKIKFVKLLTFYYFILKKLLEIYLPILQQFVAYELKFEPITIVPNVGPKNLRILFNENNILHKNIKKYYNKYLGNNQS